MDGPEDGEGRAGRRARRAALLLAVLVGLLLAGVGTASPAAAHATLVATDPAEGARLESAPDVVTLRFSEGVSLGAGYARVLTAEGQRVDTGAAQVEGSVVTVPLRADLPDDGYLVTYRVVSADSHPISGAYSFAVGDAELVAGSEVGAVADGDRVVTALLPATRWLGYGALALAVGLPALALLCWPGGWASSRLSGLATAGTVGVAVTSLAGVLLQGPYAAGTGLGSALDPALLTATLGSGAGWTAVLRIALVIALWWAVRPAWRRGSPPTRAAVAVAGVMAAGLVTATAAVGHPVAGPWPVLAVLVTAVHVGAMCLWLGGLTGLVAGLLRADGPGPHSAAEVTAGVIRFSRLAFASVAALVVSGMVQSVREIGSPAALTGTLYGRILLIKIAFVLVALAAASVSRGWVQQRLGVRAARPRQRRLVAHAFAAGPGSGAAASDGPVLSDGVSQAATRGRPPEDALEHVPDLRRSVTADLVVAVVILALSAVLVGTPPARSAVAPPVAATVPLQGAAGDRGSVQITLDPARPGPAVLHLDVFDEEGRPTQPAGIEVTLSEPNRGIGPIDVELEPAGPGHYVGDGVTIPGAGTWTLAVSVRLDEFTATTARTTFPVR